MTTLQMILCFWLAGSLLAMWKIWKPSYKVISLIDTENILVQRPILSTIVVFIIFTLFLPFMVLPLLIPQKAEEFALGFIKGAKRIK
jgi:hypothetical protein|tara:strand:+ start:318 stop:578 length:261 start_codon:yes stop_codon:yes gene_type:complete